MGHLPACGGECDDPRLGDIGRLGRHRVGPDRDERATVDIELVDGAGSGRPVTYEPGTRHAVGDKEGVTGEIIGKKGEPAIQVDHSEVVAPVLPEGGEDNPSGEKSECRCA